MTLSAKPCHPLQGTGTAVICDFIARTAQSAVITGRTPRGAWTEYLKTIFAGAPAQYKTKELERQVLQSRIVSLGGTFQAGASMADLWDNYLTRKGHTGDIVDKFGQWLDHGTI